VRLTNAEELRRIANGWTWEMEGWWACFGGTEEGRDTQGEGGLSREGGWALYISQRLYNGVGDHVGRAPREQPHKATN
jgi:hypothetical protein